MDSGAALDTEKAIKKLLMKNGDEAISVNDSMRLQLELHQINLQTEKSKTPRSNGVSVEELFKNQSTTKE